MFQPPSHFEKEEISWEEGYPSFFCITSAQISTKSWGYQMFEVLHVLEVGISQCALILIIISGQKYGAVFPTKPQCNTTFLPSSRPCLNASLYISTMQMVCIHSQLKHDWFHVSRLCQQNALSLLLLSLPAIIFYYFIKVSLIYTHECFTRKIKWLLHSYLLLSPPHTPWSHFPSV